MKTTIRAISFVMMAIPAIWLMVINWSNPSMTNKELLLNYPVTFAIASAVILAGTFGLRFADELDLPHQTDVTNPQKTP